MEYSKLVMEVFVGEGKQQPLAPIAILILGLLAERPMHPYEMFQTTVERREDRLAKIRPGTMYHTSTG